MDSAKKILPHLQQQKLTKILRNREYVKRSTERKKSQFLLREFASKDDVLNLLYGTWMTPAELCVMWLGGFRPSDVVHSTLSTRLVGEAFRQTGDDTYINNYMSEMHISMGNLRAMEEKMQKADGLRAITLDKIHSRFIKKQFAMALLAINAYLNRITALSYMWRSRPKS
ncbi:TGACG-sequence-specific DNA-binding protein TGA-2.1-like [Rutidosis leptorrhynchoides]|uniref:TGACG-sequence-specific DNA-binding protein TGA-2.1-like n=1 Tax=Rutidosis leptorrhynchoides TaxID=125765 RepID=UPI003A992CE1